MKKGFFTSLLCLVSLFISYAAPIDPETALGLAKEFSQKSEKFSVKGTKSLTFSLAHISDEYLSNEQEKSTYYYIFNSDNNQGFIIVSGDDRTKPILGYSDQGSFSSTNLPYNFKAWLSYCEEKIKNLQESSNDKRNVIKPSSQTETNFPTSLEPLLGTLAWNQSSPYNDLCPMQGNSRTVTGCVATAMAQLMYYHQWPAQGKGSNSYIPPYFSQTLSVDFSQSTYDWNNMTPTYNSNSTEVEKYAVAKLMYDCGVAVNMQYSSSASGAYSTDVPSAFINYFDYDENMQLHSREYYTHSEWIKLIKTELNEARPIYISAQSQEGGHAFICDGYDTNELFHINWGWGGMSNGYFDISILDPNAQGIGGSAGGYSFSFLQTILTGLQKPTVTSEASYVITASNNLDISANQIGRNESFSVNRMNIRNLGANNFSGEIGLGIFYENEWLATYGISSLELSANRTERFTWESIQIPSHISNGIYRLYAMYRPDGENEWKKIRHAGTNECILLNITEETIRFSNPSDGAPNLSIPEGGFPLSSSFVTNQKVEFSIEIKNTGKEAYCYIGVILESANTTSPNSYWITLEPLIIEKEKSKIIQPIENLSIPAGDYYAYVAYSYNYYSWQQLEGDNHKLITIEEEISPDFSLEKEITLNKSVFLYEETLTMNVTLKNTGGTYANKIYAYIFEQGSGSSSQYIEKEIFIKTNEILELDFTQELTYTPNDYYVSLYYTDNNNRIYYIDDEKNKVFFTISNLPDFLLDNNEIVYKIYPNPVNDFIQIKNEHQIKRIQILSLEGKTIYQLSPVNNELLFNISVTHLLSGVYILKIENEHGSYTQRIVKN